MNLPQLTAYLGSLVAEGRDPLQSKVRRVKTEIKPDEKPYAVFLMFDLEERTIRIEDPIPCHDDVPTRYGYFGNNTASEYQSYLVREVKSFHYLLTSVWNDLRLALRKHGMEYSELGVLIARMEETGLIMTGSTKGQGEVRLDCFRLPDSIEPGPITLHLDDKTIRVGQQPFKYEPFVRAALEHENKQDRFVLVIPAVREGGRRIVLSQHDDYRTLVRKINKLDRSDGHEGTRANSREMRVCYVCQQMKPDVKSDYTTKFSRTGINKVFTTKTKNSARFKGGRFIYDDAYSICPDCYQHLFAGEALIESRLKGFIARESAFFLPEGIFEPFDYDSIGRIKDDLDFAFQCKEAKAWLESVEADTAWMRNPYFVIHMVVYRTDGNSVTILETIEDVPALQIMRIMKTLEQTSRRLKPFLPGMSLGHVYRMIPVRETKKGQVDIGRVLSLYKALFSGHRIRSETLFGYASEALDKGMRQLSKERMDNYRNMGLQLYHPDKADFFIQSIVMQYLAFIQAVQLLGILDKPVFTSNCDTEAREMQAHCSLEAMESFLEREGFIPEARALFYLGSLIHRVGFIQYKKDHKSKPVLKKIQFQGMSTSEVYRLYYDVLDKLRQYDLFDWYSDMLLEGFHRHRRTLEKEWPLSEQANVFYIMSGYAYQVGVLANRKDQETKPEQAETQVTPA